MMMMIIIIIVIVIVARSLAGNRDSFAFEKIGPDVNFVSKVDMLGKQEDVW